MKITKEAMITRILHRALIDIRVAAYEQKSHKAIFKIANVVHNIPLQLQAVSAGTIDIEEVYTDILQRAEREGCEEWLANAIADIESSG